ncbi:Uncharacterised protein [Bordetella pertussis]|nr:Uncharacterised protein [Bordetella pertussis]CFW28719.1 Uncharacterised protein [Bordetella pertussis]
MTKRPVLAGFPIPRSSWATFEISNTLPSSRGETASTTSLAVAAWPRLSRWNAIRSTKRAFS